jgi:hypothetical protein
MTTAGEFIALFGRLRIALKLHHADDGVNLRRRHAMMAGGPRRASRGFFFVWTLLALGGTGAFASQPRLIALKRWRHRCCDKLG